jgi:curved DNA-binding protein CbpA
LFLRREFQRLSAVTDYFALLGQPRRPWLDEEILKQKFFALSTSVHPDRVHHLPEAEKKAAHEHYTELNAAYNCLREPKERLRHLLELHSGRKPAQVQQVPGNLVELFFEIGEATRAADEFLKRKAPVMSPLLLVNLFDEGQNISERLTALRDNLNARQNQFTAELQSFNEQWQQEIERLEQIQQTLGYLHRWNAQLQERIVLLSL